MMVEVMKQIANLIRESEPGLQPLSLEYNLIYRAFGVRIRATINFAIKY